VGYQKRYPALSLYEVVPFQGMTDFMGVFVVGTRPTGGRTMKCNT